MLLRGPYFHSISRKHISSPVIFPHSCGEQSRTYNSPDTGVGLVGSLVSPLLLGDLVVGVDETVCVCVVSSNKSACVPLLLYVCRAVCARVFCICVCLLLCVCMCAFVGFATSPLSANRMTLALLLRAGIVPPRPPPPPLRSSLSSFFFVLPQLNSMHANTG